jgi:hypothetical protein
LDLMFWQSPESLIILKLAFCLLKSKKINHMTIKKKIAKKKIAKKTVPTKTASPDVKIKFETPKPVANKAVKVTKKSAAKKTVAKKLISAPAKKTAPTSSAKKPSKKVVTPKPSLDAIAKAAYLNYRRRIENGMPGNSQSDWLDAENGFKN